MQLINGGTAVDDRGIVSFVNDFDFKDVKRFYLVENHSKGFIRAWHGHKKEGKYILVITGAAIVAVMPLDEPNETERYVLSEIRPQVLYVPPGYYNGFKTLTADTKVMFFSTSSLEESKDDDIRLSAKDMSKVWEVEER